MIRNLWPWILIALAAAGVYALLRRRRPAISLSMNPAGLDTARSAEPSPGVAGRDGSRDTRSADAIGDAALEAGVAATRGARARASLYAIAGRMSSIYDDTAHPADLMSSKDFHEGAALLGQADFGVDDLLTYLAGENGLLACMAGEALAQRREPADIAERILPVLGEVQPWPLYFALRCLSAQVPPPAPLAGRVLARVAPHWSERFPREFLREFVRERVAAGEPAAFGGDLGGMPAQAAGTLESVLKFIGPPAAGLLEEFRRWHGQRVDAGFLRTIGAVSDASSPAEETMVFEHPAIEDAVAELEGLFLASRRRSVLLVGESGVGKTAIARLVARRLRRHDWTIFEAGGAELVAGQVYYGQFEERMQSLVRALQGRRVLWVIPQFAALELIGRHQHSSIGALDTILPHIEQGEITVLGECHPAAFDRLAQAKPRVRTALTARRVPPMPESATFELARLWLKEHVEAGAEAGGDALIREAAHLAQQFLGFRSPPGNVLDLLDLTRRRLLGRGPRRKVAIRPDDFIVTLSQLTGLPASILDDREGLDLEQARALFRRRIMGQPEAVECLVERVAMIKAGVTDPGRPYGVFLFAGPTGTGKTEIARTLAEFLFGSPDRMIRLDMSEFQTPESLDRILGSSQQDDATSLADQIRKQPFAVVLLDEFEKSHERIWDLFLQVFDDGRLTDRRGITADFRHAIIILTSNLGGVIPSGLSLGFAKDSEAFRPESVTRAIEKAFRRELLNRIDRVLVFHPLSREVMREILNKELNAAFQRRGLRSRAWAVEWDGSAIDFLLEKGFTVDLGARPLKRAIERFLLAPLALTIVNRQVPAGDQFLFVSAREGHMDVEFMDPDQPAAAVATDDAPGRPAPIVAGAPPGAGLAALILRARGTRAEIKVLEAEHERLRGVVDGPGWRQSKAAALSMTEVPGFWNAPERFEILGAYEYQDRIESSLQRAGSLLARLRGSRWGGREAYAPPLVSSLAIRLHLLDLACMDVLERRPHDAFLLVEARPDARAEDGEPDRFAAELGVMYQAWAKKRGMRCDVLDQRQREGQDGYRLLASIAGFAAFSILTSEEGIHVLERPDGVRKSFERCRALVRVVAQPAAPAADGAAGLRLQAEQTFRSAPAQPVRITRRYRHEPSPLVRDSVRGWRTGNIGQVLQGDFDLIA